MSDHAKMIGVVILGLTFVLSGIGGIAVGGANAQAGWWLAVVGLVLVGLAWRKMQVGRRA